MIKNILYTLISVLSFTTLLYGQCAGIVGGMADGDDFDGDTICNIDDLDDDNDGILDTVECGFPQTNGFTDISSSNSCSNTTTNLDVGTLIADGKIRMRVWNSGVGASGATGPVPYWCYKSELPNNGGIYSSETFLTALPDKPTSDLVGYNGIEYTFWLNPGTYTFCGIWDDGHSLAISTTGKQEDMQLVSEGYYSDDVVSTPMTFSTPVLVQFRGTDVNNQWLTTDYLAVTQEGGSCDTGVDLSTVSPSGCDTDTDGDGIINSFDLDSDGDGCPDAIEAGIVAGGSVVLINGDVVNGNGTTNTTISTSNAVVQGSYGLNGLADSIETSTESGDVNYSSTYDQYGINDELNVCADDTDGDGVGDLIDLDDDNDGIPDSMEKICSNGFSSNVTSEGDGLAPSYTGTITDGANSATLAFTMDATTSTAWWVAYDDDSGWHYKWFNNTAGRLIVNENYQLTSTSGVLGNFKYGVNVPKNNSGVGTQLNNAQNITLTWAAGEKAIISNPTGQITSHVDGKEVSSPVTLTISAQTIDNSDWSIEIQSETSTSFELDVVRTIPSGTFTWESFGFNMGLCEDLDPDGDGKYNSVDVDSDGDGCFDAVEANVGVAVDANGRIATTGAEVGANGLDNDIESDDTTSATTTYTSTYSKYATSDFLNVCADTDGDGINDLFDIDDDNDGVLDIIESPNCFYAIEEQPLIGDRSDHTGFSVSSEMETFVANPVSLSIDGVETTAGNTRFTNSQAIAGKEVYKIELPDALQLDGIKFNYASTYGFFNNGEVILQGSNDNSSWTALSASVTYTTDPAPDEDIFNVTQNSGMYKYYRLLGVSGLTYSNGYGELELLLSNSYNAHDYPKTTCSDDPDGDGKYNSVDVDSDGDGCFDAVEANVGVAVDTNGRIATTGAEVGANGLDNDIESDDTATATTTYTSTYSKYATSDFLNVCADTDGDGINDLFDIDDDNDGVLDIIESPNCFYAIEEQPLIGDRSDHTGFSVSSEMETFVANPVSLSIDDSIEPNNTDQGLTADKVDYNDDGTNDNPRDTDGDTVGDWRDLDSDNDGLNDVVEGGSPDTNGDGQVDTPGTIVSTLPDTDTDGIPDVLEPNNPNLTNTEDPDNDGIVTGTDTDGDGIVDIVDGKPNEFGDAPQDTDKDGIPDSVDLDDDNDGIPDSVEGYNATKPEDSTDTDGDGTPDYLDSDSDNDGIPDLMESGLPQSQVDALDTDNDGVIDPSQEVGVNGIVDSIEPNNRDQGLSNDKVDYNDDGTNDSPRDTDGDKVGDWRDLDSDNDGLNDVVEGGSPDTNGDGEVDSPGTIISTLPETGGKVDVLEPNNPGLTTTEDPDGDGVVEGTDTDGDGIVDVTDGNPNEFGDAPFPDFTVQIASRPAVIQNGGKLSIRVNVVEITGNASLPGKPIVVRIPEETFFDFNFDPNLTKVNGLKVNNSDWEYLGKRFGLHTFKYKSSVFAGLSSSAIGFEGTVSFEGVSSTSVSAYVVDTSGGEVNFTNNRDTEKLNLKGK